MSYTGKTWNWGTSTSGSGKGDISLSVQICSLRLEAFRQLEFTECWDTNSKCKVELRLGQPQKLNRKQQKNPSFFEIFQHLRVSRPNRDCKNNRSHHALLGFESLPNGNFGIPKHGSLPSTHCQQHQSLSPEVCCINLDGTMRTHSSFSKFIFFFSPHNHRQACSSNQSPKGAQNSSLFFLSFLTSLLHLGFHNHAGPTKAAK